MEKYKVFLGSDIAKTYSDAKKFTLERVNSFSDNSYLVLFQRIKLKQKQKIDSENYLH